MRLQPLPLVLGLALLVPAPAASAGENATAGREASASLTRNLLVNGDSLAVGTQPTSRGRCAAGA